MKIKLVLLITAFFIISCGKNDAEQFVGTYTGNVVCDDEPDESYPTVITISEGSEDNKVNVAITSDGVTFTVNGNVDDKKITIPNQEISELEDFISGVGTLNGDALVIDFITDGACTFNGSK